MPYLAFSPPKRCFVSNLLTANVLMPMFTNTSSIKGNLLTAEFAQRQNLQELNADFMYVSTYYSHIVNSCCIVISILPR